MRKVLLTCGILSPLIYVGADILAAQLWQGYRYADQAVSELFAIGAPTSRLVVSLFTLSSVLMAAFAVGVWQTARGIRVLRFMSLMMLANAVNCLLLWNFFPMHMRGVEPTFTDTMHAILAINPFVLLTIVLAAIAFRNWFRYFSVATIALVLLLATSAFIYVPEILANQPTPGLGLAERAGQYLHSLWHAVLAILLLRTLNSSDDRSNLIGRPRVSP